MAGSLVGDDAGFDVDGFGLQVVYDVKEFAFEFLRFESVAVGVEPGLQFCGALWDLDLI